MSIFEKIKNLAQREGMKSLRLSGAEKVRAGLTSMEEVIRTAHRSKHKAPNGLGCRYFEC